VSVMGQVTFFNALYICDCCESSTINIISLNEFTWKLNFRALN